VISKALFLACATALAVISAWAGASAQSPSAATSSTLILLPYQEPGSNDPHAGRVTETLEYWLKDAGIAFKTVAPADHLQALANARALCAANGAGGLLIPEGRYEQAVDQEIVPATTGPRRGGQRPDLTQRGSTRTVYPTHVELRLDELGCDGVIRWTVTTSHDGVEADASLFRKAGAAIDDAFVFAVYDAVVARKTARFGVPSAPAGSPPAQNAPAPSRSAPARYALVPYQQPGIADVHGGEITQTLLARLLQRGLEVREGPVIDHLAVFARGRELCAATGAQGIIVPALRIEQSMYTGRSHAELRLSLLTCSGAVVRQAPAEADMGRPESGPFSGAVVTVSERAMDEAIPKLFP
jgi:hypothetical protein